MSQKEQKAFRRKAAAIFQDPFTSIDPYMTAYESVAEPLMIHGIGNDGERRERVVSGRCTMCACALRKRSPASTRTCCPVVNGQRLSIARALVLQPQFIVADEPVSMVDASSRAELLALLRELQERVQHRFSVHHS